MTIFEQIKILSKKTAASLLRGESPTDLEKEITYQTKNASSIILF